MTIVFGNDIIYIETISKGDVSMNITIIGNYQEKAAAPIYYGSFKVAKTDYDSGNTTQYFNREDVENTEIFVYATKGHDGDSINYIYKNRVSPL